jgi:serine O-acetyltransferase
MISSKKDLKSYLEADAAEYNRGRKKPRLFGDEAWKYLILLRKFEYHLNLKHKFRSAYYHFRVHKLGVRIGIDIPPNVIGKGLYIVHRGIIVISAEASIGEHCHLFQNVTIGVNLRHCGPKIGNNVTFCTGSTVVGPIVIADGTTIGANSFVSKDISVENQVWGGVPAHLIKTKN